MVNQKLLLFQDFINFLTIYIQQKLFNELNEVFEGDTERSCTFQDTTNLKYLECCIKESLRLYPSFPIIAREITEEVHVGKRLQKRYLIFPRIYIFIYSLLS